MERTDIGRADYLDTAPIVTGGSNGTSAIESHPAGLLAQNAKAWVFDTASRTPSVPDEWRGFPALAATKLPAVIVRSDRSILDINGAARALVGPVISIVNDRLNIPGKELAFRSAIAACIGGLAEENTGAARNFLTRHPSFGRTAIEVRSLPVSCRPGDALNCLLVVLKPLDHTTTLAPDHLKQLFDLTAREADTILLLARGNSMQEVAVLRGVNLETIKSQVKSARRKMEADDIAGVVRIVERLGH